jgi:hypothetical protein
MRSITPSGIDHVMRVFFRHATEAGAADAATARTAATKRPAQKPRRRFTIQRIVEIICEEEALERDRR